MLLLVTGMPCVAAGAERIEIVEPLGANWPGEWLTRETSFAGPALSVVAADGKTVPAQWVKANGKNEVLFLAAIRGRATNVFTVAEGEGKRDWRPVVVDGARVSNGLYALDFSGRSPMPAIEGLPTTSSWPAGVEVRDVKDEWVERGPARAILRRTFRFADPAQEYEITFDCRAEDPWIGVVDRYSLGKGSSIKWDMSGLKADRVYHPHSYNARNSQIGGDQEDSTLDPEKHAIATLGPIWRDIWFGGGPFAFVYATNAPAGIGVAAVRGGSWGAPDGVTLESQNLFVHGDREREGRVWVRIPTDGGTRHWAIVPGPNDLRKRVPDLIRRRVEIVLDTVTKEWILDWPSSAPPAQHGMLGVYLGGSFNEHLKGPTTYARRVRGGLPAAGPVKSADMAALAYIFTNPDYWPGLRNKWAIGNPNFHTDMYPTPFLIGLLMPDHPHAKRWVDYGIENLKGQIDQDSFPGGSWKESLSYSGAYFSVARYLDMAAKAGFVNAFREWPRVREVATWFACMETPVDPRYGKRQMAPLGDTGAGSHVGQLNGMASYYEGVDDLFAEQLRRFPEKWEKALDISSRAFPGFGAALRGNLYDERNESYVTFKAGPARNHYQGDELSFFFASLSTPLAIDYACHYSPRPWHAAMHNRPDMNNVRPVALGIPRAFATNAVADAFVADERTSEMNHVPLEPQYTSKPGWEYPTTFLPAEKTPWTFRRYAMLVKHDPRESKIADYLVVRDEIESPEPVWWNLHILARAIEQQGGSFLFPGQFDVDLTAHVLTPEVGAVEKREWGWGGTLGDRRGKKGKDYESVCFGHVIPKDFKRGTWNPAPCPAGGGEMAKWLRVQGAAGRTEWLVVLAPHKQGQPVPKVERLSPTSARIVLGGESETVHLGTAGKHQAAVERGGKTTVLLAAGVVKELDKVDFSEMPASVDQGGR
jgi:hypothetical protein